MHTHAFANNMLRKWNRQFMGRSPVRPGVVSFPVYNSPLRKKAHSVRRKSLMPQRKPGILARIRRAFKKNSPVPLSSPARWSPVKNQSRVINLRRRKLF